MDLSPAHACRMVSVNNDHLQIILLISQWQNTDLSETWLGFLQPNKIKMFYIIQQGAITSEAHDGVASLEALGYHGNQIIQERASDLLQTYFSQDRWH